MNGLRKTLTRAFPVKKLFKLTLCGILPVFSLTLGSSRGANPPSLRAGSALANRSDRPPLIQKNTFPSPEAALRHFCARDAWGFVWSGLLRKEIEALTLWKTPPLSDGFHVIQGYSLGATVKLSANEVEIPVTYQSLGTGQGNGAFVPAGRNPAAGRSGPPEPVTEIVRYRLRKVQGQWKITSPEATQIEPRVLVEFSPAKPLALKPAPLLPERLRSF
jgi:hypothetical protein